MKKEWRRMSRQKTIKTRKDKEVSPLTVSLSTILCRGKITFANLLT